MAGTRGCQESSPEVFQPDLWSAVGKCKKTSIEMPHAAPSAHHQVPQDFSGLQGPFCRACGGLYKPVRPHRPHRPLAIGTLAIAVHKP